MTASGLGQCQLCIRHALQSGTVALPKSTHPERMVENAEIDFVLSGAEMAFLDSLSDAS